MPANRDAPPAPPGGWLSDEQLRAWIAFMQVRLRMSFEMNRQLQADSGLSLADYDILAALSSEPDGRMAVTALSTKVGWERSRTSHQIKRMNARGLVDTRQANSDRRVTETFLTEAGWHTVVEAAPAHVELVRTLFFDCLPKPMVASMATIFETINANLNPPADSADAPKQN
jgi:DNA-binding MarR family transcriptional regulator